ncbi:hypothetical protein [Ekhidna sp.]|uniref:hypothetical protein n=1 Tax=Ekhidna sp. TaxID=2608089 RepID=UPI003298DF30
MKSGLLLILVLLFELSATAQVINQINRADLSTRPGYIVIDGSFVDAVLLPPGKKRFFECIVRRGSELTYYSPYEISEYGFTNGRSYLSRPVTINGVEYRVFLERFYTGENSIFYLKTDEYERFYLEISDGLVELNRSNYKQLLSSINLECPTKDTRNLKLSIKSIRHFMDCSPPNKSNDFYASVGSFTVSNFPVSRFIVGNSGAFNDSGTLGRVGFTRFKQIRKRTLDESNFHYGFGLNLSKYSLTNSASTITEVDGSEFANSTELLVDILKLNVPVYIKYRKAINKVGFTMMLGAHNSANFGEVNINNVRLTDGNVTSQDDFDIMPDYQFGLSFEPSLFYAFSSNKEIHCSLSLGGFFASQFQINERTIGIHYVTTLR